MNRRQFFGAAALALEATHLLTSETEDERYERLEKEHLGDSEKQTGIYAPKPRKSWWYQFHVNNYNCHVAILSYHDDIKPSYLSLHGIHPNYLHMHEIQRNRYQSAGDCVPHLFIQDVRRFDTNGVQYKVAHPYGLDPKSRTFYDEANEFKQKKFEQQYEVFVGTFSEVQAFVGQRLIWPPRELMELETEHTEHYFLCSAKFKEQK
jgi:hypothetical protein